MFSSIPFIRKLIPFFLGCVCSCSFWCGLNAQKPDVPVALASVEDADLAENRQLYLRKMSADAAMEFGFSSIAEEIYSNLLLQRESMTETFLSSILEHLVLAELNNGNYDRAETHYSDLESTSPAGYQYLKLLLLYQNGRNWSDIGALFSMLPSEDPIYGNPWVSLVRALWLLHQGKDIEAQPLLETALLNAANPFQRTWMESLVWREEILSGESTETLAISLKAQIENAVNPLVMSQLTQQYAIVLVGLGRDQEAIAAVEEQLPLLGEGMRSQRDRLLMFLALIAGRESGKSNFAIKEILTVGQSERIRLLAFYYWLTGLNISDESTRLFVEQILEERPDDDLRNEFLYVLALSGFYAGELGESSDLINRILDSSENADLQDSALRVMIGVCWSQDPPQYRLAAEHLQRLREIAVDPFEKDQLSLLIADSYYLNGDHDNALPYYKELISSNSLEQEKDEILFKITNCYLALGNADGARPVLDEFQRSSSHTKELVWASEWNYNLQLVESGRRDAAIERLQTLRSTMNSESSNLEDWSYSSIVRLGWLLGYLYYQGGEAAQCVNTCEVSLNEFESFPDEQQRRLSNVKDELALLTARAKFAMSENETAIEILRALRDRANPETAASSYMVEARYFWSAGDAANAQRALIRLADLFPTSQYAPVALYEAAMNVEAREEENSDQEAIALYERIATDFRDHPLHLVSRLRQGDLLRKSNQFSLAIPFYEGLLSEFSGDERLYLVQMALGESYLALGSTRSDYINEATRILERIYDINNLPVDVRLEAGTKAAAGLIKVNRIYRAEEILWRVISLVRTEPEASHHLGSTGRYWLARAVLTLSDQLKADGRIVEHNRLIDMAEQMKLPGLNLMRNR